MQGARRLLAPSVTLAAFVLLAAVSTGGAACMPAPPPMQDPPLENPVDPLPVYTPGESLGRSVISLAALPPAAPEGAGAIWFSLALLFMVVRLGGSILRAPAA